ncbi:MAG: amidohydrolase family protein [Candidatus Poribacteria bacterium]|nr:amidohydrolase family protein [Candidatus Poribacteria bacterium]
MKWIDVHVHVGRLWDAYPPMTVDIMLRWMDANEIEAAVPLPLESPESSSYYILTRDMLALCKQHPDRFIPFCVVDPRVAVSDGKRSVRNIVKQYAEEGAKGFGELKAGLPFNDPKMQALYAACDEFRLPLLFHCDHIRCTDDPQLTGLEAMLAAYPNVQFIGHAQGFWAAVSGDARQEEMSGYPKRPVAPGGAVDRLMDAYGNLYADLSAGSGHNAITRDWAFGEAFLERRHTRLLFGTDFLRPNQPIPQFEMFAKANLSEKARRAIAYENASRLFGQT